MSSYCEFSHPPPPTQSSLGSFPPSCPQIRRMLLPLDFWNGCFTPWVPPYRHISSVQFSCSVVSDSAIPWTAAHQASLFITNSQSLLKLMSFELVMRSNHLFLCRPLLLLPSIFSSFRVFSNELALCINTSVTKVLELQLQHQSFPWIFRVDFL